MLYCSFSIDLHNFVNNIFYSTVLIYFLFFITKMCFNVFCLGSTLVTSLLVHFFFSFLLLFFFSFIILLFLRSSFFLSFDAFYICVFSIQSCKLEYMGGLIYIRRASSAWIPRSSLTSHTAMTTQNGQQWPQEHGWTKHWPQERTSLTTGANSCMTITQTAC